MLQQQSREQAMVERLRATIAAIRAEDFDRLEPDVVLCDAGSTTRRYRRLEPGDWDVVLGRRDRDPATYPHGWVRHLFICGVLAVLPEGTT